MEQYKIEIASVPHRNGLVAEVWLADSMIAEINMDHEEPEIELFATSIPIPLEGFQGILAASIEKLKGEKE